MVSSVVSIVLCGVYKVCGVNKRNIFGVSIALLCGVYSAVSIVLCGVYKVRGVNKRNIFGVSIALLCGVYSVVSIVLCGVYCGVHKPVKSSKNTSYLCESQQLNDKLASFLYYQPHSDISSLILIFSASF